MNRKWWTRSSQVQQEYRTRPGRCIRMDDDVVWNISLMIVSNRHNSSRGIMISALEHWSRSLSKSRSCRWVRAPRDADWCQYQCCNTKSVRSEMLDRVYAEIYERRLFPFSYDSGFFHSCKQWYIASCLYQRCTSIMLCDSDTVQYLVRAHQMIVHPFLVVYGPKPNSLGALIGLVSKSHAMLSNWKPAGITCHERTPATTSLPEWWTGSTFEHNTVTT